MILACEQCQTRFQLDERRIPSSGARVRCSKCNHAFFVRPPEVEAETTLQGIVAGAVEEAIPEPEPDGGGAPDRLEHTDPGLSEALEPFDEVPPDEWTFDDEAPDARGAAPVPAPIAPTPDVDSPFGEAGEIGEADPLEALAREVAEAPAAAETGLDISPPPAPERGQASSAPSPPSPGSPDASQSAGSTGSTGSTSSANSASSTGSAVDDLGDPSEWDFLAESVPAPPSDATVDEQPAPAAASAPATRRRRTATLPPRLQAWASRAVGGLGWALCVGLILAGLGQTLRAALAPPAGSPPLQARDGGPEVRDLAVRNLENLHGGPILVVAGVVAPRREGPLGLQVQLLDALGEPLEGATAWAGPALAERALRELDPVRLRSEQGAHSADLTHGGAFHAIFDPIPDGARGVALKVVPLPPAASEAEAAATASSPPPSPLPSPE